MVNRALRMSSMLLLVAIAIARCGSSRPDVVGAEEQRNFGVRMAKMNLWREAMFRFKRAVELNPSDAMAHNNLAVAYEANGDFDSALKEYREAMRIDKSNQYIAKNYSRYVEFTQRNKKRQKKEEQKAASATPANPPGTSSATPPTDTPPGPPPAPPPPPEKPPGNAAVSAAGSQASRLRGGETPPIQPAGTPALRGGSR